VLTVAEVERVLAQPDLDDPLGVRDRSILETFYSTGLRRAELRRLEVFDVDAERGLVMVRQGKGKKDRLVPIGQRALGWIERYRLEVRPSLVVRHDDATLYIGAYGEAMGLDHLTRLAHRYVEAAQLGKQGSCHLFRHTMATLMLENGADVRFIQEMLGHSNLSTTQVYTHVAVGALKQVHTATHPARLERAQRAVVGEESSAQHAPAAAELLSSLAAEADDEDEEPAAR
jgi:integrase/recombinase XerD